MSCPVPTNRSADPLIPETTDDMCNIWCWTLRCVWSDVFFDCSCSSATWILPWNESQPLCWLVHFDPPSLLSAYRTMAWKERHVNNPSFATDSIARLAAIIRIILNVSRVQFDSATVMSVAMLWRMIFQVVTTANLLKTAELSGTLQLRLLHKNSTGLCRLRLRLLYSCELA